MSRVSYGGRERARGKAKVRALRVLLSFGGTRPNNNITTTDIDTTDTTQSAKMPSLYTRNVFEFPRYRVNAIRCNCTSPTIHVKAQVIHRATVSPNQFEAISRLFCRALSWSFMNGDAFST